MECDPFTGQKYQVKVIVPHQTKQNQTKLQVMQRSNQQHQATLSNGWPVVEGHSFQQPPAQVDHARGLEALHRPDHHQQLTVPPIVAPACSWTATNSRLFKVAMNVALRHFTSLTTIGSCQSLKGLASNMEDKQFASPKATGLKHI